MKRIALVLLVALGCASAHPGSRVVNIGNQGHRMAALAAPIQADAVNFNPQQTALTATPGALSVQNILGTLKQVNDQGVASTLGGGGGGTVTADAPLTGNVSSGSHLAISAATTSTPGSLAAADKTKIDTLASGGQYDAVAVFAKSIDPALTMCRAIPFLTNSFAGGTGSAPTTASSALEGGGLKTGSVATVIYLSSPILQTMKTGHWLLAYRSALGGSGASGHDTQIGVWQPSGPHAWQIERRFSTSTTKYTFMALGSSAVATAGTVTADNGVHTFVMAGNGSTARMYVDPVVGSSPDATASSIAQMIDEPMMVNVYTEAGGETDAQWVVYCYVAP